jgi:hypothetical protein
VQLPQYRPEVVGGGFRPVVLRVVTPQRHGVVVHLERLFDVCRCDRREILSGQPPGEFHGGPGAFAVIDIVVESDDNVFGFE